VVEASLEMEEGRQKLQPSTLPRRACWRSWPTASWGFPGTRHARRPNQPCVMQPDTMQRKHHPLSQRHSHWFKSTNLLLLLCTAGGYGFWRGCSFTNKQMSLQTLHS
jgi:hypothetical protein